MSEDKTLDKEIELDDGIRLVYQKPDEFTKYHAIYYGQKYADYFFRSSPSALIETAKIFDCGYFIMKDDHIIGGVYIKPNFMADLFLVPPYKDYEGLLDQLLSHLRRISSGSEKILIREVVEECLPAYKKRGCQVHEVNYWMSRPTQALKTNLPDGYLAIPVLQEDIKEIANVIMVAYLANPSMEEIGTKEFYITHVENFLRNYQSNEIMCNSSKAIIHQPTKNIVGVCLHMEFENYPLIMSLAVKPEHQGQGIGQFLLKHSITTTSKAYPATRLAVLKGNPAIKLYEKLGFIRNESLTDVHLV